ncbi:hypothetical protein Q5P01_010705 [Channa striata]|uniref:Uncharacterized protein n=1 Tax=Channa striata TaxID=64152 RepID=A0AA88SNF8_CHASR|nr:hypothetical protein Q5P01_010705 [Channa striata]
MQRGRAGIAGSFDSLISTGKELFGSKLSALPVSILSVARFRGKLGEAIAVIISLIVGFLTMPNTILYFTDSRDSTRGYGSGADRGTERGRPEYKYVYIHAGIALITLGCLAMVVSIVLSFFAATTKHEHRLHNMECAIALFNIVIYVMYVVTMVLMSTVLKEKQDEVRTGSRKDATEIAIAGQPLLLQQQGQWESLLFAIQHVHVNREPNCTASELRTGSRVSQCHRALLKTRLLPFHI